MILIGCLSIMGVIFTLVVLGTFSYSINSGVLVFYKWRLITNDICKHVTTLIK